ncbi:hypothetical protein KEM56_000720 [Ascosphaera pollenicola]|nr:hypothetical protein KEM56_000720 [Ascosphaera pollenicola]
MIALIGNIPASMLSRGSRSSRYFDERGQFRYPDLVRVYGGPNQGLPAVIPPLRNETSEDVEDFISLLALMLRWRPEDRRSTRSLLEQPFLNKNVGLPNGMEQLRGKPRGSAVWAVPRHIHGLRYWDRVWSNGVLPRNANLQICNTQDKGKPGALGGIDSHQLTTYPAFKTYLKLLLNMSGLTYKYSTPYGKTAQEKLGYSQAVRVGDIVHLSGQGGWKQEEPPDIYRDIKEQIDQAFRNVDTELRGAGVKNGWDAVFKVRTWHVPLNDEALQITSANIKHWIPSHAPLWTCLGNPRLAYDDMRVEVEVEAYAPEK